MGFHLALPSNDRDGKGNSSGVGMRFRLNVVDLGSA